ncbi:MAG: ATP-grasp domain-containing protein [Bacteroidales bacterium]|nr:ATP-grasp domain-containing protein [Bacteroidales bacterium]
MQKLKILVFPCGSEIGLEVFRSLQYSTHIELFGGSSVDDHGKFVYQNYFGNLPFIDAQNFIENIRCLVKKNKIDAIYPAMDKVIWKLKTNEEDVGCKVISSPAETTTICLSKRETYNKFCDKIAVPEVFGEIGNIQNFPVFVKPNIGYGSRGAFVAYNKNELNCSLQGKKLTDYIITEYLPGEEYTVDCFTDRHGVLKFIGPRIRNRISNGISVNTKPAIGNTNEFSQMAEKINENLKFRGAWFFQVKRDQKKNIKLLEIASRLGGSSSLYRGLGVNFALLSIFDAFNIDIEVIANDYEIELDRALESKFKINIHYENVYVDLDDCIILNEKTNTNMIKYLYQCINNGKKIILLTKHPLDLENTLKKYRLDKLFDEVIHINNDQYKSNFIMHKNSIFIDDSFEERKNVSKRCKIPVFSPDMIEILL